MKNLISRHPARVFAASLIMSAVLVACGGNDDPIVAVAEASVSNASMFFNRTATFVFHLGPRYFGSLTAYVVGPDAARYRFTSGLPVQILGSMGPTLMPYLGTAPGSGCPSAPP
jgi:hypothetical protein